MKRQKMKTTAVMMIIAGFFLLLSSSIAKTIIAPDYIEFTLTSKWDGILELLRIISIPVFSIGLGIWATLKELEKEEQPQ